MLAEEDDINGYLSLNPVSQPTLWPNDVSQRRGDFGWKYTIRTQGRQWCIFPTCPDFTLDINSISTPIFLPKGLDTHNVVFALSVADLASIILV